MIFIHSSLRPSRLNSFCPLRHRGQLYEAVVRGDVHAVRAPQVALHYTTRRDDDRDDGLDDDVGDDGHVDNDSAATAALLVRINT